MQVKTIGFITTSLIFSWNKRGTILLFPKLTKNPENVKIKICQLIVRKIRHLSDYNENLSKIGGDFSFFTSVLGTEKKWGGVS